jgi:hypothetical protein
MEKIIKFIAQDDHVWNVRPKPYSAAKNMPKWWKDIPLYGNSENKLTLDPHATVTVKRCVPTIDILTAGYYVPLWSDIIVDQQDGFPLIKWNSEIQMIDTWGKHQVNSFKIIDGYSKVFFKNFHGWTIRTPPGWSSMFIHPVAYPDLPFYSISGIVDTDVYDGEINVPFVVKNNFKGIIEKDTPMFQVIPFKREKWNSEFDVKKPNEHYFYMQKLYSKIQRGYYHLLKDKKIYR